MLKRFLISFICLFPLIGIAQTKGFVEVADPVEFKQKAAEVAEQTQTIISDFVQEKSLAIMDEKIISSGKFNFKKESSIRWEYEDPFKYLIIIKNGEIFIKDGDKENKFDMNANKTFASINDMILSSVQGKIMDNEDFAIKIYKGNNQYMVQLIPEDEKMKDFLSKIQIFFDTSDYTVARVKMIESSDDYTSIEFKNRKINQPVSDEKFTFN